jgi:hypothetical protein
MHDEARRIAANVAKSPELSEIKGGASSSSPKVEILWLLYC